MAKTFGFGRGNPTFSLSDALKKNTGTSEASGSSFYASKAKNTPFGVSRSKTPYSITKDVSNPSAYSGGYKPAYDVSPADAATAISYAKDGWTSAMAKGDTASADHYHSMALPYYKSLIASGNADDAAYLHGADADAAFRYASDKQFDAYADEQKKAQYDIIDQSTKNLVAGYDANRDRVNQDYSDVTKNAYVEYMRQQNALPQQLKASGITGGLSESSHVALAQGYGQQASQFARDRLNALQDIDLATAEAKASGDAQKRQVDSELAAQRYAHLSGWDDRRYQTSERVDSQAFSSQEADKDRTHNASQQDKQNAFTASQQDTQNAFTASENALDRDLQKDIHDENMAYQYYVTDNQLSIDEEQSLRAYALDAAAMGVFEPLAKLLGVSVDTVRGDSLHYQQQLANMPYIAKNAYTPPKTYSAPSGGSSSSGVSSAAAPGSTSTPAWLLE